MFQYLKMWSFVRRGSSYARAAERGATLAELLVVLAIMSILAAIAVPFAETAALRGKEHELRETLRDVRDALDRFNDDWRTGAFEAAEGVSDNGYPTEIGLLVEGVTDKDGAHRRYLRDFPRNPFGERGTDPEDQWLFLGYADPPDATIWNGEDIYDLRALTERIALDGTPIAEW